MNFFEHQEQARRSTRRLVLLFAAAVLLIVLAVWTAAGLAALWLESKLGTVVPWDVWGLRAFLWIAGATLAVVVTGSLSKTLALRRGGPAVAALLGGRPVEPNTRDLRERRLLNVVEEMALASGLPVPSVFVLPEEKGINAFAAGLGTRDTVVGVTRGALEHLRRDELQGVVAHEFSHVLNGDTRINVRLMGLLHGILVIALIGYWILRIVGRSSSSSSRSSRSDKKGGGGAVLSILAFAVALLAIGYIGVFFGRLIKAAVSRQRELLGDAAAVQFTRDPSGVAGALKKIGAVGEGSRVTHMRAEEASHLFFGNALAKGFSAKLDSLLATHPPLVERVRRLDPTFDGRFPEIVPGGEPEAPAPAAAQPAATLAPAAPVVPAAAFAPAPAVPMEPREIVASVGQVTPEHVQHAAALIESLPEALRDAVHEPPVARAVVCALLLDRDADARRVQLQALEAGADSELRAEVLGLAHIVDRCPVEARLALVDLALPALRRLSRAQYEAFRATVERLVTADERLSLLELVLRRVLVRHLEPHFGRVPPAPAVYGSVAMVREPAGALLSLLAHAGTREPEAAAGAFASGAARLRGADLHLLPRENCSLALVDGALDALARTTPPLKARIVEACASVVVHDGQVKRWEAELLRAVADALECPMPPLLGASTAATATAAGGRTAIAR